MPLIFVLILGFAYFIFSIILFRKNIHLLLLYPKHVVKLSWYNLGCYSGSKYIFLVLYVDDILLAINDTDLLIETKQLLFNHFEMKDLEEVSYVLGIQILCDRPSGVLRLSQHTYIECILRLSQHAYIERILKRFNMQSCSFVRHQL